MPKIVDHDARRAELAQALWRVVARSGLDSASVRVVAAESGWSVGAVRYYFSTQAELARFAMEAMARSVTGRIVALYADESGHRRSSADPTDLEPADLADPAARRARALETLAQLLPLDEDRRVEVLVWLEFVARARFDPSLDEPRSLAWEGSRHLTRLALADAAGLELPRLDGSTLPPAAEEASLDLHLTVDGLAVQATTYPEQWPPEQQLAALERSLDRAVARALG